MVPLPCMHACPAWVCRQVTQCHVRYLWPHKAVLPLLVTCLPLQARRFEDPAEDQKCAKALEAELAVLQDVRGHPTIVPAIVRTAARAL